MSICASPMVQNIPHHDFVLGGAARGGLGGFFGGLGGVALGGLAATAVGWPAGATFGRVPVKRSELMKGFIKPLHA